jgi:ABC-type transport system involved in cytochrome bd biosynthesis fused ATPase/permease subunit
MSLLIKLDPDARLTAHDLTIERNGNLVVKVAEFSLGAGELVRLSAPSGAGKSTLLLALSRLIPYEGRLRLGEVDATDTPPHEWRRAVGLATHPPICLEDNLGDELLAPYKLAVRSDDTPPDSAECEATLASLGLEFPLAHPTERLSQGERSRVALARALLCRPSVLLLDEPTANLDKSSARLAAAAVDAFVSRGGRALVATHDEAWNIAQRSYVFKGTDVEVAQ